MANIISWSINITFPVYPIMLKMIETVFGSLKDRKSVIKFVMAGVIISISFAPSCINTGSIPAQTPVTTNAPTSATAILIGTVNYAEHTTLPPDSIVNVKLFDVTPEDAPRTTIGEQQIITRGKQVPIAFEIRYDPESIDPKSRYRVRASIIKDGQTMFTSVTSYPVITLSNLTDVSIEVRPVPDIAREYRELRSQKGHWNGGEFNPDLDSPGGRLRMIMGALGETFGQPPFKKSQITALMGEPDSTTDAQGSEHLVYLWRNWHDYLFFVCQGEAVVSFDWWYAWE